MRSIFIAILIVITTRGRARRWSSLTIYETADDLIRVALGLAVLIWLAVKLLVLRRDVGAYRTWFCLGSVLLPPSVLCAVTIW